MAIKVIKEGKEENYIFEKTCPICECTFTHELCDLKKDYDCSMLVSSYPAQYHYIRYVECPCCHERVIHDNGCDNKGHGHEIIYTASNSSKELIEEDKKNKQFYVDYDNPGVVWNTGINGELDCDKCPNKPNFKDGEIIFGDTPCTWCPKMQPKCNCK